MNRRYRTPLYTFLVTVVLVVVVALVTHPGLWQSVVHLVTLKRIAEVRSVVHQMGVWGPVLVILLMIFHSVTFIPSEVITIMDVVLFGPVWGVVYAWVGSMLGAYLAFFLARIVGRPIVKRFVSQRVLTWFDNFIKREGRSGIFVLRLIPLVSFNALNYACGLTNISFWDFTWTTGIGILPAGILMAVLYQSAVGQKYAFIGLTVVGVAMIIGLIFRAKIRKKYRTLR